MKRIILFLGLIVSNEIFATKVGIVKYEELGKYLQNISGMNTKNIELYTKRNGNLISDSEFELECKNLISWCESLHLELKEIISLIATKEKFELILLDWADGNLFIALNKSLDITEDVKNVLNKKYNISK